VKKFRASKNSNDIATHTITFIHELPALPLKASSINIAKSSLNKKLSKFLLRVNYI
jgi:hypothetical protein